jgi:hypothetical protein
VADVPSGLIWTPPPHYGKWGLGIILHPEDGAIMFPQYVGRILPDYTALNPRDSTLNWIIVSSYGEIEIVIREIWLNIKFFCLEE